MAAQLKLISVNIEGNKHLLDIEHLLATEKPDLVCMQEVFAVDVPRLQSALGGQAHYVPMMNIVQENKYNIAPAGFWGVLLLSTLPEVTFNSYLYRGELGTVPEFKNPNSPNRVLVTAEFEKDSSSFRVATTHFTWSAGGLPTDEQRQDAARLRSITTEFDEVILCGDFNAPRGGEISQKIAAGYADAIPADVTTTIDPERHYAGALELVVDGMFYTDTAYQLKECHVQAGVSDHQAVIATFTKKAT